ncbi:hypothetical protein CDL15_Pgr013772 [Punica granatum]|uniref:Uncharacterized protein n=1 Tax=Punica granatum TaxID=22663 RepID=A0A218W1C6_PUNGR|nr:hypothetical protein CDL15_Pgr013772 [Punica granatum]PKI43792.1 hypothetical protein CRG98_035803 [Punica granatum]
MGHSNEVPKPSTCQVNRELSRSGSSRSKGSQDYGALFKLLSGNHHHLTSDSRVEKGALPTRFSSCGSSSEMLTTEVRPDQSE